MVLRRTSNGAVLLAAASLAAAACGISLGNAETGTAIPEVRFVLVQPERAAIELEQVKNGGFRALPRAQFERLYHHARDIEANRDGPVLLAAHYRARLDGNHLQGEGRWILQNRGEGEGLLALEPLQPALRSAVWSDGRPAPIAAFTSGGGVQLLVDRPGQQSLELTWSARGLPEPAGCRFDLQWPHCPISTLELDLPADREPRLAGSAVLLGGPTLRADHNRRIWRIGFAGDDLTELRVTPADQPEPLVFATVESQQDVQPGQTQCEFRFDLEVVHGPLKSFKFDCSRGFVPTEVVVRNLARWETTAAAAPQVSLDWSEPFSGGSVVIRGFAMHPIVAEWISPGVSPIGAVLQGERLTVHAGPSWRLGNVRPGAFRIVDGTASADRGQSLVAISGPLRSGTGRMRARLQPIQDPVRLRERTWWQADGTPSRATIQWTLEPQTGLINRSLWVVPPGWTISALDSSPPDLISAWQVGSDADFGRVLAIDWAHAIQSGRPANVTVKLKQTEPDAAMRNRWPNLRPISQVSRTGILAIRHAPNVTWPGIAASKRELAADDRTAMPGDAWEPHAVIALDVAENMPKIGLRFEPFRCSAATSCHVEIGSNSAQMTCRLIVDAGERPITELCLVSCDPRMADFVWEDARDRSTVRITEAWPVNSILMATAGASISGWNALCCLAPNSTRVLQLKFKQPVIGRTELIARGSAPLPISTAAPFQAFQVLGASETPWTVSVDRRSAPMWICRAGSAVPAWSERGIPGIQQFRLAGGADSMAIVPAHGPRIVNAQLVVDARESWRIVYRASADVVHWNRRSIPVSLPADCQFISARIDGHAVIAPKSIAADALGTSIVISAPPGDYWRLELDYSLPAARHGLSETIPVMLPRLFDENPDFRLKSILPAGWRPWASDWRSSAGDDAGSGRWDADTPVHARAGNLVRDIGIVQSRGLLALVSIVCLVWLIIGRNGPRWVRRTAFIAGVCLSILAAWRGWPFETLLAPVLMTGVFLVALRALRTGRRRGADARIPGLQPTAMIALAMAGCLSGMCGASPPAAILVTVIPDASGQTDRDTILLRRDFFDQLTEVIGRRRPGEQATMVAAQYEGRAAAGSIDWTARFRVYCPVDEGRLSIPFRGLILSGLTVDGHPGFPSAEREAIAISIRGRGWHDVECKCSSADTESDERSVQFPIAESPCSRLVFEPPTGARQVRAVSCRGAQQVSTTAAGPRLEADLGRTKVLHVRWNAAAPAERSPFQVQETYLWDISEMRARLLADWTCRIEHPVDGIDVDLPHGVEVFSVRMTAKDPPGPGDSSPWLAKWSVQADESKRRLHLEFSAPVSGSWAFQCEFRPTVPLSSNGLLCFPAINGANAEPAVCAWRLDAGNPVVAASGDFRLVDSSAISRRVSPGAGWDLAGRPPNQAYHRRRQDAAAALRIRPRFARPAADARLTWSVGDASVGAEWSGKLRSTGNRFQLIEWDVPDAVAVNDVEGVDVAFWNRTGNRLQVWTRKPVAETALRWVGSIPRSKNGKFELPSVRLLRAGGTVTQRVVAEPGLNLTPLALERLEAANETGIGNRVWEFRPTGTNPGGVFQVDSALGTTDFQLRTNVDRLESGFRAVTTIDGAVRRGAVRSVAIRADNAADAQISVTAAGAAVTEGPRTADSRLWFVDFPRDMQKKVHIEVTATNESHPVKRWSTPCVSVVMGANRRGTMAHTLTVVRNRVRVTESSGLESDGDSWRSSGRTWRMVVSDPASDERPLSARVRFVEHGASALGGASWIRSLTARVECGAGHSMAVRWPSPVQVLWVELDGRAPSPQPGLTSQLALPDGREGVQTLRIVWQTPQSGSVSEVGNPQFELRGEVKAADETMVSLDPPPGTAANVNGTPISRAEAARRRSAAGIATQAVARTHPFAGQFEKPSDNTWIVDGSKPFSPDWSIATSVDPDKRAWRAAAIAAIAGLAWFVQRRVRSPLPGLQVGLLTACGWLATDEQIWLAGLAAIAVMALFATVVRRLNAAGRAATS